jgi:hypothetical protein
MRRAVTLASVLVSAGLIALTAPAPAHAATGTLTVSERLGSLDEWKDPAPGCYEPGPGTPPFTVNNQTNSTVEIYIGAGCGASGEKPLLTLPRQTMGSISPFTISIRVLT